MKLKIFSKLSTLEVSRTSRLSATLKVFALIALQSCAHLAELDREDLNRSSMDLSSYQKAKSSAPLSQLSGLNAEGQSAGCSVCAH